MVSLPPLLNLPVEGQLDIIISNLCLYPSLESNQKINLSSVWWGDNKTFYTKLENSSANAKVSFGVCCDEDSFRQYLSDAEKLTVTLAIDEDSEKLQSSKNFVSSPEPKLIRSATHSNLESDSKIPDFLRGTPRHRILEKKRRCWNTGENIGTCDFFGLKLNARGEFVTQGKISNLFGDVIGTLDLTMLYTSDNIDQNSSSEVNIDVANTSADCSSLRNSEIFNDKSKENLNKVPNTTACDAVKYSECKRALQFPNNSTHSSHTLLDSLNKCKNTEYSHMNSNFTQPNSCQNNFLSVGNTRVESDDASKILNCKENTSMSKNGAFSCHYSEFEDTRLRNSSNQHNLPSHRTSDDSISDESILNYLREVDPQSLVECGALRHKDLPKFLRLIHNNTPDDHQVLFSVKDSKHDNKSSSLRAMDNFESATACMPGATSTGSLSLMDHVPEKLLGTSKDHLQCSTNALTFENPQKLQRVCESEQFSEISVPSGSWPLHLDTVNNIQEKSPRVNLSVNTSRPDLVLTKFSNDEPSGNIQSTLNNCIKFKTVCPDGKELVMIGRDLEQLTGEKFVKLNSDTDKCSASSTALLKESNLPKIFEEHGIKDRTGLNDLTRYSNLDALNDEDCLSVASDETYTTSSVHVNSEPRNELLESTPGTLLVVEIGTLTLHTSRNIFGIAPSKFKVKGVRDRCKVSILTTLSVEIPDAEKENASEHCRGSDVNLSEPKEAATQSVLPATQSVSEASMPLHAFTQPETAAVLEISKASHSIPTATEPVRSTNLSTRATIDAQAAPLTMTSVWDNSRLSQSVTLVSRNFLPAKKVKFDTVEMFDLTGLSAPEQLRTASLIIRVYRRVLGQRESELLCSSKLSLWHIYRLPYGHLNIPLEPCIYEDKDFNIPSKHKTESIRQSRQPIGSFDRSPTAQSLDLRLNSNVWSTNLPRRTDQRRFSGSRGIVKSVPNVPTSGEMSLFIKLFLNEQYVDDLRNSIIVNPSIISNFGNKEVATSTSEKNLSTPFNLAEGNRIIDDTENRNYFKSRSRVELVRSADSDSVVGVVVENVSHREQNSKKKFEPIISDIPLPENRFIFTKNLILGDQTHPGLEGLTSPNKTAINNECSKVKTPAIPTFSSVDDNVSKPVVSDEGVQTDFYLAEHSPATCFSVQNPLGLKTCVKDLCYQSPSVSFIRTLSQKFNEGNEYMIKLHIEILEAKDLANLPDGSSPHSFVRGTFFGTDVITDVCRSSTHPVWNLSKDIIVSSNDVIGPEACIVIRVYHQPEVDCSNALEKFSVSERVMSLSLIACLALQPPSPFWPGQVSLCGWYPLLDIRGLLAGHIKLSLTIVESVLCHSPQQRCQPTRRTDLLKSPNEISTAITSPVLTPKVVPSCTNADSTKAGSSGVEQIASFQDRLSDDDAAECDVLQFIVPPPPPFANSTRASNDNTVSRDVVNCLESAASSIEVVGSLSTFPRVDPNHLQDFYSHDSEISVSADELSQPDDSSMSSLRERLKNVFEEKFATQISNDSETTNCTLRYPTVCAKLPRVDYKDVANKVSKKVQFSENRVFIDDHLSNNANKLTNVVERERSDQQTFPNANRAVRTDSSSVPTDRKLEQLMQRFAWVNISGESDSPCASYVDTPGLQSCKTDGNLLFAADRISDNSLTAVEETNDSLSDTDEGVTKCSLVDDASLKTSPVGADHQEEFHFSRFVEDESILNDAISHEHALNADVCAPADAEALNNKISLLTNEVLGKLAENSLDRKTPNCAAVSSQLRERSILKNLSSRLNDALLPTQSQQFKLLHKNVRKSRVVANFSIKTTN